VCSSHLWSMRRACSGEDRTSAPSLKPLVRLECKVEVEGLSAGDAYHTGTWRIVGTAPTCGGAPLQPLILDEAALTASVMLCAKGSCRLKT